MSKLIYIFFLVSSLLSAQVYKEQFSSDICNCFDENNTETKKAFDETIFEKCFSEALEKNQKEFLDYFIKDIDTTNLGENSYQHGYELGYKEGQRIFEDIQKPVIDNCDSYYHYSSSLIALLGENLKKGVGYKALDSINNLIDEKPENTDLIWQRGALKMALEEYDQAQLDFKLSLDKEPYHLPSLFFSAWSYELNGNPEKAIEFLEILINKDIELGGLGVVSKMFLAIIERREEEKD